MPGIKIEIRKDFLQDKDYHRHINHQILDALREYTGHKLNLIDNYKVFKGKSNPIGFYIETDNNYHMQDPYYENLFISIKEIPIQEYETKFISKMEELKFDSEADKATFRERLEILFKGRASGGSLKCIPKSEN